MTTSMARIIRNVAIGAVTLGCSPALALAAPARYVLEPAHTQVRVLARSTLHDFEVAVGDISGEMVFDPQSGLQSPTQLRIPVESLRTGVDVRDRAMRQMFEAERFPDILVTIDSAAPLSERRWHVQGRVRIRDVEQPIDCEAQADVTEGELHASGRLPLTTTMFRLKPPSVLGLIRVNQRLMVEFDSRWRLRP